METSVKVRVLTRERAQHTWMIDFPACSKVAQLQNRWCFCYEPWAAFSMSMAVALLSGASMDLCMPCSRELLCARGLCAVRAAYRRTVAGPVAPSPKPDSESLPVALAGSADCKHTI